MYVCGVCITVRDTMCVCGGGGGGKKEGSQTYLIIANNTLLGWFLLQQVANVSVIAIGYIPENTHVPECHM